MNTRPAIVFAMFLVLASTCAVADGGTMPVAHSTDERAEAMNRMGVLYATGTRVPRDYARALAWLRSAAENGSVDAMNNIAAMHYYGLGVPLSYEDAASWLRVAVRHDDAYAQNKLGLMYEAGQGVPRSDQVAFTLFSRSAARGHAPGMVNLGRAYAQGLGVARDDTRAYVLISAAIEIGVSREERDTALFELGSISQRLDEKQRERAQADARALIDMRAKHLPVANVDTREAILL